MLTSWICPTTVWSNNLINKYDTKELNEKLDPNNSEIKRFMWALTRLKTCLGYLTCLCSCLRLNGTKNKDGKDQTDSKENCNKSYMKRSKILVLSSATTSIILFSTLCVVISLLCTNDLYFPIEDFAPILHCKRLRSDLIPGK